MPFPFPYSFIYIGTPPYATNVSITGVLGVGQAITGNYTYNDDEGDVENGTTFKWYKSVSETGEWNQINNATNQTYVLKNNDLNNYIKFEVTVRNIKHAGNAVSYKTSSTVQGDFLTKVKFTYTSYQNEHVGGGIENETDANGGSPENRYIIFATGSGHQDDKTAYWDDSSGTVILWNNRYNYRIGVARLYSIKNIKLYKNDSLAETQTYLFSPISSLYSDFYAGTNLNPNSRVESSAQVGSTNYYPK